MVIVTKSSNPETLISHILKDGISGRRAVNQLYETFQYMTRNAIQTFQLSEPDALAAYNQAFTSMIEAIRTGHFRGESSLKTYMFRAFKNQCINLKKQIRRSAEKLTDLGELQWADDSQDCVRQLMAKERLESTLQCMDKLSGKARAILWGSAYEGLSSKELAEQNDLKNAATVDVLKRRYRQQLKQMMKEAA